MDMFEEFTKIVNILDENSVDYAIIGGIAMAFHAIPRFTMDIDILVHHSHMPDIPMILQKCDYIEAAPPWTFQKSALILQRFVKTIDNEYMILDILSGNSEKFSKIISRASKEPFEKKSVKIASKEDLIWLKSLRNSDQDKIDIKNLRC